MDWLNKMFVLLKVCELLSDTNQGDCFIFLYFKLSCGHLDLLTYTTNVKFIGSPSMSLRSSHILTIFVFLFWKLFLSNWINKVFFRWWCWFFFSITKIRITINPWIMFTYNNYTSGHRVYYHTVGCVVLLRVNTSVQVLR